MTLVNSPPTLMPETAAATKLLQIMIMIATNWPACPCAHIRMYGHVHMYVLLLRQTLANVTGHEICISSQLAII